LQHEENIVFVGYSRPFSDIEKGTFGKAVLYQQYPIYQTRLVQFSSGFNLRLNE
jgi:hypothetical protein